MNVIVLSAYIFFINLFIFLIWYLCVLYGRHYQRIAQNEVKDESY